MLSDTSHNMQVKIESRIDLVTSISMCMILSAFFHPVQNTYPEQLSRAKPLLLNLPYHLPHIVIGDKGCAHCGFADTLQN